MKFNIRDGNETKFSWKGIRVVLILGLAICGVFWVVERLENGRDAISKRVGTYTINIGDTAYVVTTRLDSVYYEEGERGGETHSSP